jgi:hypothetical protein
MIIELGCYQIRPAHPGLSLWKHVVGGKKIVKGKYQGRITQEGWKPMGLYPHDYAHALRLIGDDYANHSDTRLDMASSLRAVTNYIKMSVEQAKVLDKLGKVDADVLDL